MRLEHIPWTPNVKERGGNILAECRNRTGKITVET